MKTWFQKGLKFGCTACGKCCHGSQTNVFLNAAEIQNLADHLNIDRMKFMNKYTDDKDIDNDRVATSLKNKDGACILLNKDMKSCSVYKVRPIQCQTYPFWPSIMTGGKSQWEVEAMHCEGIVVTPTTHPTSPPSTPLHPTHQKNPPLLIPRDTILRNMILMDIHDRGCGQNWSHDTSLNLLMEAEADDPELIESYAEDFSQRTGSKVLYEDSQIRVVDGVMLMPTRSNNSNNNSNNNIDTTSISSSEEDSLFVERDEHDTLSSLPSTTTILTRRLEIIIDTNTDEHDDHGNDNINANVSGVVFLTEDGTPDHSISASHRSRVITRLCLYLWATSTVTKTNSSSSDGRVFGGSNVVVAVDNVDDKAFMVAVLGAGPCLLPSHMLAVAATVAAGSEATTGPAISLPRIHAVEPRGFLLQAASQWFDVPFGPHLTAHIETSSAFLKRSREQSDLFDVMVMDLSASSGHDMEVGVVVEALQILAVKGVLVITGGTSDDMHGVESVLRGIVEMGGDVDGKRYAVVDLPGYGVPLVLVTAQENEEYINSVAMKLGPDIDMETQKETQTHRP
eukprot:gene5490-11037_t